MVPWSVDGGAPDSRPEGGIFIGVGDPGEFREPHQERTGIHGTREADETDCPAPVPR